MCKLLRLANQHSPQKQTFLLLLLFVVGLLGRPVGAWQEPSECFSCMSIHYSCFILHHLPFSFIDISSVLGNCPIFF